MILTADCSLQKYDQVARDFQIVIDYLTKFVNLWLLRTCSCYRSNP
jgi:hypothetical protein